MRCPRISESSRRSPRPGSNHRDTSPARSARLSSTHRSRAANAGIFASNSGSSTSTANSGISPTIDRTFSGSTRPSGSVSSS